MEPARPEPGHGRQQLGPDRGREHPHHRGVGKGRVGEVHRLQVRPLAGQRRAHEGQVVVLDEDPSALGGDLGHPLGELLVELAVGLPGLGPSMVGPGPAGGVEQMVVAEPQHGVGHDVVGQVVDLGLRVDQLDVEPVVGDQPGLIGRPVGLPEGAGHPGGPGAGHHGAQRPGQPSGRLAGHGHTVLEVEGQRAPVGDDHRVGQGALSVLRDAVGSHV